MAALRYLPPAFVLGRRITVLGLAALALAAFVGRPGRRSRAIGAREA